LSISGISSQTSNLNTTSTTQSNFWQQLKQLADALGSGNLSDAQQAYAALNQIQDSDQGRSASSNSPLAKALNTIGQALQKGDLAGAQQALQSFRAARGGHHHHGHHGSSDSSAPQTTSPNLAVADTSTSTGVSVDIRS